MNLTTGFIVVLAVVFTGLTVWFKSAIPIWFRTSMAYVEATCYIAAVWRLHVHFTTGWRIASFMMAIIMPFVVAYMAELYYARMDDRDFAARRASRPT